MKAYWNGLSVRERWMLGIGGVLCAMYLFYAAMYVPISRSADKAATEFREKRETLAWMRAVQAQYQGKKNALKTLTSSQLLTVIATQLNNIKSFKPFPYQLQQIGTNDVQLAFDKIPYNVFLGWLWALHEQYALSIKQWNVEKTDVPGVVKLVIVMQGTGEHR